MYIDLQNPSTNPYLLSAIYCIHLWYNTSDFFKHLHNGIQPKLSLPSRLGNNTIRTRIVNIFTNNNDLD